MAATLKSPSFSEHRTKISDGVVVDVEQGFCRHDLGTEDFSDFSIKPGIRDFTKKSPSKVADHKQIKGNYGDGEVIFIPASCPGTNKVEKSPDPIVGAATNHHHINVGFNNLAMVGAPKPKFIVKRSHSGRPSLPWILRPRRLFFLFATLSSMGTLILIYLTLLISKGNK